MCIYNLRQAQYHSGPVIAQKIHSSRWDRRRCDRGFNISGYRRILHLSVSSSQEETRGNVGSAREKRPVYTAPSSSSVYEICTLDRIDGAHPSLECHSDRIHTWCHCSITTRVTSTSRSTCPSFTWRRRQFDDIDACSRTALFHARRPQRFYMVRYRLGRCAI